MQSDQVKVCRVDFSGAQTTRNIQVAHERMSLALSAQQSIEINCRDVTEFDLSLIQLILSAKRSAEMEGKSLTLSAPADGKLCVALERAGFLAAQAGEAGTAAAFWLKDE
ncbi:MAG: STAS domain-containing protein [Pseudolabrys sp.]